MKYMIKKKYQIPENEMNRYYDNAKHKKPGVLPCEEEVDEYDWH
jgi:hypothetical protein